MHEDQFWPAGRRAEDCGIVGQLDEGNPDVAGGESAEGTIGIVKSELFSVAYI